MATVVRCNNCGAEYHRTDEKFLVPQTGHASCTICGDTLEYWVETTHVAMFELVARSDGSPDTPQTPWGPNQLAKSGAIPRPQREAGVP